MIPARSSTEAWMNANPFHVEYGQTWADAYQALSNTSNNIAEIMEGCLDSTDAMDFLDLAVLRHIEATESKSITTYLQGLYELLFIVRELEIRFPKEHILSGYLMDTVLRVATTIRSLKITDEDITPVLRILMEQMPLGEKAFNPDRTAPSPRIAAPATTDALVY